MWSGAVNSTKPKATAWGWPGLNSHHALTLQQTGKTIMTLQSYWEENSRLNGCTKYFEESKALHKY